jgi:hypothetical protein
MDDWSRSDFQVEHFWEMLASMQADLYVGDGRAALHRMERRWPELSRSLLLRVQLTRLEALHLRARAALAAALEGSGGDRAALTAAARRDARRVAREKTRWATPLAGLLRAAAADLSGDRDGAVAELRAALAGLDAADMKLYAAAARRQLAGLVGGDEGRTLDAEAGAFFAGEGIVAPERMVRMLVPGFPTCEPHPGGQRR